MVKPGNKRDLEVALLLVEWPMLPVPVYPDLKITSDIHLEKVDGLTPW